MSRATAIARLRRLRFLQATESAIQAALGRLDAECGRALDGDTWSMPALVGYRRQAGTPGFFNRAFRRRVAA